MPTPFVRFLAHFLFILAAWTVVIKYLFPIGFAIAEGSPPFKYVMLDLWPLAHVWVGWLLLNWSRWTVPVALAVSVVEIAIVVTKFALFLSAPQWTIWRTNWFINKIFVLAVFVLLLGALAAQWTRNREVNGVDSEP
jgi:hypothetical protein